MGHVIFDAFADPTWRDIDDEWIRGEIPTSERARRQFALVRMLDEQRVSTGSNRPTRHRPSIRAAGR